MKSNGSVDERGFVYIVLPTYDEFHSLDEAKAALKRSLRLEYGDDEDGYEPGITPFYGYEGYAIVKHPISDEPELIDCTETDDDTWYYMGNDEWIEK